MFAGLILFLLIGFPVAFSLASLGLFFSFIAIESNYFGVEFMQALPARVFGIMSNELLLAIPFFTLMGVVLEKSGLAEDLMEGFGQLFGSMPGASRRRSSSSGPFLVRSPARWQPASLPLA